MSSNCKDTKKQKQGWPAAREDAKTDTRPSLLSLVVFAAVPDANEIFQAPMPLQNLCHGAFIPSCGAPASGYGRPCSAFVPSRPSPPVPIVARTDVDFESLRE
ncbi:unnamed protein product [Symbiodinium sp. CCMP2456]|nr:unnamed protein product [Symbiodinium sp. CCMP2456]